MMIKADRALSRYRMLRANIQQALALFIYTNRMTPDPKLPPLAPLAQKPSPTEQTELTNTGAKARPQKPPPLAVRGTPESDAAVAGRTPGMGDTVRVDVERVDWRERKPIHNAIVASSVNGQLGMVIGMEVVDGMHMLRVSTAHASMLVPAECCMLETPPPEPSQMHEPRQSPEKMRKPPGASGYKLT
jgi:hypothetical protein